MIFTFCSCNDNNNNNNDNDRWNSRFFTLSSLGHELSPTCILKGLGRSGVQIMSNTLGAYQVRHVVCHVVCRDSSTSKSDRVEIAFVLAFHWLKALTDECKTVHLQLFHLACEQKMLYFTVGCLWLDATTKSSFKNLCERVCEYWYGSALCA